MKTYKDVLLCITFLTLAYYISSIILYFTDVDYNSAMIFFVAVVAISRYTEGYWYGIISSLISTFAINYFFMYPYWRFNMSISGYPVAMLCLLVSSLVVSALTSRMKEQTERNAKLYKEQAEIKLVAEKERMRGNLLRAVSHDLRTPLTGIYGASSVILENKDSITKEEMVQFAQNIKTDTQWLINMVENLLSVTRINESGGTDLKKKDELFEEIVAEAVQKTKRRFPDVKITIHMTDDIVMVPMDSMLIQQVIINLIENAIRHCGNTAAGIEVYMHLDKRDGRDVAIFEVRDYGHGIEFEDIDSLIENASMHTDISSDATRGLGLGLSVCKSIIRAHGGFLEAENAEDGGAIFRFGLEAKEVLAYE